MIRPKSLLARLSEQSQHALPHVSLIELVHALRLEGEMMVKELHAKKS